MEYFWWRNMELIKCIEKQNEDRNRSGKQHIHSRKIPVKNQFKQYIWIQLKLIRNRVNLIFFHTKVYGNWYHYFSTSKPGTYIIYNDEAYNNHWWSIFVEDIQSSMLNYFDRGQSCVKCMIGLFRGLRQKCGRRL